MSTLFFIFVVYYAQDVYSVIVPDVWGSYGGEKFEDSFLDNVLYAWQKSSTKESSNIIACNIKDILNKDGEFTERPNSDYSITQELVKQEMKKRIKIWLETNTGVELFQNKKNKNHSQPEFKW